MYSLPSSRILPLPSRLFTLVLDQLIIGNASARIKPFSKSVWMTPAACGAVSPLCGPSADFFGPTVK
jgi:hypothetical protein